MKGWSCKAAPFFRRWGAGAASDGKLFWTGGDDPAGNPGASLWIYRLNPGVWCRGPDLPLPVSRHDCAVLGEELYCVGGRGTNGPIRAVQVYHIPTGRWRLAPPLPHPLWQHAVLAAKEELLCLGGIGGGKTLDEVWGLRRGASHWSPRPPLCSPRRGHACQALDAIYCMGGSLLEGGGGIETVERREHATGIWRAWSTLPSPGWAGSGAVWRKSILYLGFGQRQARQLHPFNQGRSLHFEMPASRSGAKLLAVGEQLLLLDGTCLWQHRHAENIL